MLTELSIFLTLVALMLILSAFIVTHLPTSDSK